MGVVKKGVGIRLREQMAKTGSAGSHYIRHFRARKERGKSENVSAKKGGTTQCFCECVSHRIWCAFPPTLLLMLHNLTFPQLTPSQEVPAFLQCRQTGKPCMHAFSDRCALALPLMCLLKRSVPIVNNTAFN